jgi:hypothetical protein
MRPALRGVWVVVGALALMSGVARATEPAPAPRNQLTFDLGAASIGMTHAWRTNGGGVLIGGGGGMGLSPLFGAIYATGTHFDYRGVLEFAEYLHAQLLARFELASWLRVDGGLRVGLFAHSRGDYLNGGEFAGLFAAPALCWRWVWVGPRVSGNLLWEHTGERAGILVIEYVMLRFVKSW